MDDEQLLSMPFQDLVDALVCQYRVLEDENRRLQELNSPRPSAGECSDLSMLGGYPTERSPVMPCLSRGNKVRTFRQSASGGSLSNYSNENAVNPVIVRSRSRLPGCRGAKEAFPDKRRQSMRMSTRDLPQAADTFDGDKDRTPRRRRESTIEDGSSPFSSDKRDDELHSPRSALSSKSKSLRFCPDEDERQNSRTSSTEPEEVQPVEVHNVSKEVSNRTSEILPDELVPEVWEFWTTEEVDPSIRPAFSRSEVSTIISCAPTSSKDLSNRLIWYSFFYHLMLAPDSWKRVAWDCIALTILGYDVMMIPLMAFQVPKHPFTDAMDLVTMTVWTIDIFMSFVTGYRKVYVMEMRPEKVALNYIKRSFVPDLCIQTFDWMAYIMKSGMANAADIVRMSKVIRIIRVIRVLKLLRLLRLPSLLRSFKEHIHSDVTMGFLRIIRSLLLIILVNHFVACAWYALGAADTAHGRSWTSEMVEDDRSLSYRYFTALHWSITQFTPASMEVSPVNTEERIFAIIVVFFGLVLFSSFVSSITTTMAALRMARYQDINTKEKIRRYMSQKNVSMKLGAKVSTFLESYKFHTQKPIKREDIPIFKVLPKSLQLMLDWEVYKPVLSRHPLLNYISNTDTVSMLQLCGFAEELSLTTCQELFHPGMQAVGAYFAIAGVIRCYHGFDETDPKEIDCAHHLWLCEPALWLRWRHRGRVMAVTTSSFVLIGPSALHSVLATRPKMQRLCMGYALLMRQHFEALFGEYMDREQEPRCSWDIDGPPSDQEMDTQIIDMIGDFSDDTEMCQQMLNASMRQVASTKNTRPSTVSSDLPQSRDSRSSLDKRSAAEMSARARTWSLAMKQPSDGTLNAIADRDPRKKTCTL